MKNHIVNIIFFSVNWVKCRQFKDKDLLISIRNVGLKGKNLKTRFQEGVVRMASTWYVGFSALMMAVKSCSILVGGKKRKFDGESINSQSFCLVLGIIKTDFRVRRDIAFETFLRNVWAENPLVCVPRTIPSPPLPRQDLFTDAFQCHAHAWLNRERWIESDHRSQA